MKHPARTAAGLAFAAVATIATIAGSTLTAAGAVEAAPERGTVSLAEALAPSAGFDDEPTDFDIAAAAAEAVLAEEPRSKVRLITEGERQLTAFLPTDLAFERYVTRISGEVPRSERAAFRSLADTRQIAGMHRILLDHLVPGVVYESQRIYRRPETVLTAASGQSLGFRVTEDSRVFLVDGAERRGARLVLSDINADNRQVAHAIDRVLVLRNAPTR